MLLHYIYLIAICAEAVSGALMGIRKDMDIFGICLIGAVAALGGGTVRDVLIGHYPLGWVLHPEYLAFTICAAIVAAVAARALHHFKSAFLVVDALGLVAFTIIGCDIARSFGAFHPAIVVILGMVTGVFGGLLRDVLCNEIPLVLRREIYASVSLLTGAMYVGILHLDIDPRIATLSSLLAGFSLRLLAIRFHWELPRLNAERVRGFD
ncbi:trimeric intracellular cation channel family protein [Herbaspirillum sp. LeCh32-8]|uniref:trimeric intracellular cation channel family protein n=1 Tax=Herbaspirillum sp. LeCh32-8 TaxID=2821356 RepID=UPI001AE231D2|nr:trimeric intracellular cation channel family protein [Herbaspirillum sp. LeCh32-8]MBP0598336.1 trimeric intracellular cation channel family protein [Herbaspirillum sp. LeCh32-8]